MNHLWETYFDVKKEEFSLSLFICHFVLIRSISLLAIRILITVFFWKPKSWK